MDNHSTRAALRTAISFGAPHGGDGDRRDHAKAIRFATLADTFMTRHNLSNVPIVNAMQLREAVIVILAVSVPKHVDQERVEIFYQAIEHLLAAGVVAALLEHANSMDTDPDSDLCTEHLYDVDISDMRTTNIDYLKDLTTVKGKDLTVPVITVQGNTSALDSKAQIPQGDVNITVANSTTDTSTGVIAHDTDAQTVQGNGTIINPDNNVSTVPGITAVDAPDTVVSTVQGTAILSPDTDAQTVQGNTTIIIPDNKVPTVQSIAAVDAADTDAQTVQGNTTIIGPDTIVPDAQGGSTTHAAVMDGDTFTAPGDFLARYFNDASASASTNLISSVGAVANGAMAPLDYSPGTATYLGFEDFFSDASRTNSCPERTSPDTVDFAALNEFFTALLDDTTASPSAISSATVSSVLSSLDVERTNQALSPPSASPETSSITDHDRKATIAGLQQVLADQLRAVATTRRLLHAYQTESDADSTTAQASISISDPNDSSDQTLVEDAKMNFDTSDSDGSSLTANKSFDYLPQSGRGDFFVANGFLPASKVLNKSGIQRRKGKHAKNTFGWTMSSGRNKITSTSNNRHGGASSALLPSSISPSSVPNVAALSATSVAAASVPSTLASVSPTTPASEAPSMLVASAPSMPSSPASMEGASPASMASLPQSSMPASSPPSIPACSALATSPPDGGAMHRALGYSLQQYPLGVGIRRLLAVVRHQATKEPASGPERQMLEAYVQHYQGRAAAERIINDASPFVNFAVRKYPGENGQFDQVFLVDVELPYFAVRQAPKKWHPTLGLTTPAAIANAALSALSF
ncbi:hypothetical protein OC842_004682 [Tilletia horrida]|uniref:Uncharacterized protein n=1 Tax=Tilletia horrida TaxID=155126 RepID=A0AAN6JJ33_9BASI|nr:hypothetical protein OC842_004682 [Tilletia horrida]